MTEPTAGLAALERCVLVVSTAYPRGTSEVMAGADTLCSESRIVVLRALPGLGDLLCAVPALRALRAAYPRAELTLAGLPSSAWFVARYADLVDELLVVEGVAGLPEVAPDPPAAVRFLQRAQGKRFDLALQIHGSGIVTNPLLTLFGARRQVTAHLPGHWLPPGTSIEYPDEAPEIGRTLGVVGAAGCPPVGFDLELPVTDDERRTAATSNGSVERSRSAGAARCGHCAPKPRWANSTASGSVADVQTRARSRDRCRPRRTRRFS